MNNVAKALNDQGEYAEAEKMHRETLELRKKVLGDEHPDTLASMYSLARILAKQLRYGDSRFLFEQACAAYNTVLGKDHPIARACHQHYCRMLALQEQARISICSERLESNVDGRTNKRCRMV